ncbi:hypothetical protein CEUSTIGMA_g11046.t1 [Chlamydomonas eustigma]|uniref:PHD-type domain-containing protein n=1 Tax=Chlamydomonas eustigma TaxID=1157962 RepID=A0A250XL53_9CHLO|nr:hypothetical protein CEUSTIGMA_g11046.t1 [Chlamydomonas eustigma]|eukprot:GAX83622.1 hypothetical protein CEUSTIGMA_g11046.t1 [Chlamydomonas eustigma]
MVLQCGICLDEEDIKEVGELHSPGCYHTFCFPCISRWSKTENKCPTCRDRFTVISRKRLLPDNEHDPSEEGYSKRHRGEVIETINVTDKAQEWRPDASLVELLENLFCAVCQGQQDDHCLLLCDGCDSGYHTYCVGLDHIPEGEWYCQVCQEHDDGGRVVEEIPIPASRNGTRTSTTRSSSNPSSRRNASSSAGVRASRLRASLTGTASGARGRRSNDTVLLQNGSRGLSSTRAPGRQQGQRQLRALQRVVRQASSAAAAAELPDQDPSVTELEDDVEGTEYDPAASHDLSSSSIEILEVEESEYEDEISRAVHENTAGRRCARPLGTSRQRSRGATSMAAEAAEAHDGISVEEESLHQRLRRHLMRRSDRSADPPTFPTGGASTVAESQAVRFGTVLEAREAMRELRGWGHLGSSRSTVAAPAAPGPYSSTPGIMDGTATDARAASRLVQHGSRAAVGTLDEHERSWDAFNEAIRIERVRRQQTDLGPREELLHAPLPVSSQIQYSGSRVMRSDSGTRGWHERGGRTQSSDIQPRDQNAAWVPPGAAAAASPSPGSAVRLRAARAWARMQQEQQQRHIAESGGAGSIGVGRSAGRVGDEDHIIHPSRREMSAAQLARLSLEQVIERRDLIRTRRQVPFSAGSSAADGLWNNNSSPSSRSAQLAPTSPTSISRSASAAGRSAVQRRPRIADPLPAAGHRADQQQDQLESSRMQPASCMHEDGMTNDVPHHERGGTAGDADLHSHLSSSTSPLLPPEHQQQQQQQHQHQHQHQHSQLVKSSASAAISTAVAVFEDLEVPDEGVKEAGASGPPVSNLSQGTSSQRLVEVMRQARVERNAAAARLRKLLGGGGGGCSSSKDASGLVNAARHPSNKEAGINACHHSPKHPGSLTRHPTCKPKDESEYEKVLSSVGTDGVLTVCSESPASERIMSGGLATCASSSSVPSFTKNKRNERSLDDGSLATSQTKSFCSANHCAEGANQCAKVALGNLTGQIHLHAHNDDGILLDKSQSVRKCDDKPCNLHSQPRRRQNEKVGAGSSGLSPITDAGAGSSGLSPITDAGALVRQRDNTEGQGLEAGSTIESRLMAEAGPSGVPTAHEYAELTNKLVEEDGGVRKMLKGAEGGVDEGCVPSSCVGTTNRISDDSGETDALGPTHKFTHKFDIWGYPVRKRELAKLTLVSGPRPRPLFSAPQVDHHTSTSVDLPLAAPDGVAVENRCMVSPICAVRSMPVEVELLPFKHDNPCSRMGEEHADQNGSLKCEKQKQQLKDNEKAVCCRAVKEVMHVFLREGRVTKEQFKEVTKAAVASLYLRLIQGFVRLEDVWESGQRIGVMVRETVKDEFRCRLALRHLAE